MKPDEGLVKGILTDERAAEMIDSIVHLPGSQDFRVIAGFIEKAEQRDAFEKAGCLLYQGFLYSPAVDRDSLISMKD